MVYHKNMKKLCLMCVLTLALHLAAANPANSEEVSLNENPPPKFEFPSACKLNEDCWVIKSDAEGTDIVLQSEKQMEDGVPVLAAEQGTVVFIQEDRENKNTYGNMVIVKHDDGWKTIYGNLKPGSITVEPGSSIKKNSKIAEIGMSGKTECPKLHFAVFKNGQFHTPIWKPELEKELSPKEIVILNMGVSTENPEQAKIKNDEYILSEVDADAGHIYVWLHGMLFKKGDFVKLSLYNPWNEKILTTFKKVDEDYNDYYYIAEKTKTENDWKTGIYTAKFEVIRPASGIANEHVFSFNIKEPELTEEEKLLLEQEEQEKHIRANNLRRRKQLYQYKQLYEEGELPDTVPDNVKEKLKQLSE